MNVSPEFSPDTAYLLVIHGSRDPRPGQAAQVLAHQVGQALGGKSIVEFASLECASVPLHQQIVNVGDRILRLGYSMLKIVPLFLSPGVHVRDDIPEEVSFAQTKLGDRLSLEVLPYLGSYAGMVHLLAQRIDQLSESHVSQEASGSSGSARLAKASASGALGTEVSSVCQGAQVILMAHGSRRTGGNQPIEAMASQLGAITAYWSVAPKLMDQIPGPLMEGCQHITIIPYFLFAGALTDAIAEMVAQLRLEHPDCAITLGTPLGETSEIVTLVTHNIQQNNLTSCTLKN